jgi:hypothetical protein
LERCAASTRSKRLKDQQGPHLVKSGSKQASSCINRQKTPLFPYQTFMVATQWRTRLGQSGPEEKSKSTTLFPIPIDLFKPFLQSKENLEKAEKQSSGS